MKAMRKNIFKIFCRKYFFFGIFFLLGCSYKLFAQSIGNGEDGSPEISGIINRYTFLINDAVRCDGELFVDNSSGFSKDDLILIIQMQGAIIVDSNTSGYGAIMSYNSCGNYEYAKVRSVVGGKIVLQYALLRNYSASGKTQIIRVPQYQNPVVKGTVTCPPWNGNTGGIISIDATGTVRLNAEINAVGTGFRAGQVQKGTHVMTLSFDYLAEPDPTYYSLKGEGIAFYGISPDIAGRGAPANGGGGGNIHTSGGGGGSNNGCGGGGGWGYPVNTSGNEKFVFGIGGYPLFYSDSVNKIFMAGGGGSGHEHFGNGTSGANGGGIIFITCNSIDGGGNYVYASGNGAGGSGAYGDGAGGGGSGGTICIAANNFLSSLNINTSGGNGGSTILRGFGPGGGGGGGTIWLSSSSIPATVSVNNSRGIAGTAGGISYGATNGCDGNTLFNLKTPSNSVYPPVSAAFTPSLSDLPVVSFQNQSSGATKYLWNFGNNTSDSLFQPQHTFPKSGIYNVVLVASNDMCSASASHEITTGISNVFTPNGDGKNDSFSMADYVSDSTSVQFTIYNRWGNVVFEGDNNSPSWDGKIHSSPAGEGTYYYVAKIQNSNTVTTKQGYILLIK